MIDHKIQLCQQVTVIKVVGGGWNLAYVATHDTVFALDFDTLSDLVDEILKHPELEIAK